MKFIRAANILDYTRYTLYFHTDVVPERKESVRCKHYQSISHPFRSQGSSGSLRFQLARHLCKLLLGVIAHLGNNGRLLTG